MMRRSGKRSRPPHSPPAPPRECPLPVGMGLSTTTAPCPAAMQTRRQCCPPQKRPRDTLEKSKVSSRSTCTGRPQTSPSCPQPRTAAKLSYKLRDSRISIMAANCAQDRRPLRKFFVHDEAPIDFGLRSRLAIAIVLTRAACRFRTAMSRVRRPASSTSPTAPSRASAMAGTPRE